MKSEGKKLKKLPADALQDLEGQYAQVSAAHRKAVEEIQEAALIESEDQAWLTALLLWKRSLDFVESGLVLMEKNMLSQALALGRCSLESLVYAAAIWRDPSMYSEIKNSSVIQVKKLCTEALDKMPNSGARQKVGQQLQSLHASVPRHQAKKFEDWAKAAALKDLTDVVYQMISSRDVHSSFQSILLYLESDGTAIRKDLKAQTKPIEFFQTITLLGAILYNGSMRLQESLPKKGYTSPSV